jgi:hypothetical protein
MASYFSLTTKQPWPKVLTSKAVSSLPSVAYTMIWSRESDMAKKDLAAFWVCGIIANTAENNGHLQAVVVGSTSMQDTTVTSLVTS